jgi:hypothetical protein
VDCKPDSIKSWVGQRDPVTAMGRDEEIVARSHVKQGGFAFELQGRIS